MQALGDFVRRRRKSVALSQEELARRADCSTATVRSLEAGASGVTLGTLSGLADALGVSVTTLARVAGRELADE